MCNTFSTSNALLGIEVDIDVEHGGQRSKVTPAAPNQDKSTAESTSSTLNQHVQTKPDWNSADAVTEVTGVAEQIQDMVIDSVPTQMEEDSFQSQVQILTLI